MRQSLTIGAIAMASLAQVTIATTAMAELKRLDFFNNAFFSGNDVYEWCQGNRSMALAYTAALVDSAGHSIWVLETMRPLKREEGKDSGGSSQHSFDNARIDLGVKRIAAYCRPSQITLNQVTDVFCNYLLDTPQERHGLPPILFNDAMTKAWPCPQGLKHD